MNKEGNRTKNSINPNLVISIKNKKYRIDRIAIVLLVIMMFVTGTYLGLKGIRNNFLSGASAEEEFIAFSFQ